MKEILTCIPGVKQENIKASGPIKSGQYEQFRYTWETMKEEEPIVFFEIPDTYIEKFIIEEKSICFHIRENNLRDEEDKAWLSDGSYYQHEPERFVKSEPYIKLATDLANEGWQIIVLGDKGSTAFPEHDNIFNLCHLDDKSLLDDFYAVSKAKYIVASTSCMQVAGRVFNRSVLHTDNVHPYKRWWFGDVNLFKKLIYKKTGRVIGNEEFISRWGLDPFKIPFYPARSTEYELVDCEYEEIKSGLEQLISLKESE